MPAAFGGHGNSQRGAGGNPPGAPTNATSITKDAAATISFLAPAQTGSSAITSYTVTPYIGAAAQSTTTVNVGSLGSITGSDGNTYKKANVTGLTNSTAYTFTVKATNSDGTGTESTATGANTPLSGLVFGDDFNGPTLDPEWYVLNRCGYIAQSEVQWYLPSQVTLSSSNLVLTAQHTSHSGPSYPSDGNTTRNQSWISGAVQGNTLTFTPSGATMTFEVSQQVCADAGSGFWPGLFWLEGSDYLTAWKTDPFQAGWDSTGKAELDVAEWFQTGAANSYGNVSWAGTNEQHNVSGTNLATALHTYQAIWTPGTNVVFKRDGSTTATSTVQVPDSGAHFFPLIYLQMLSGGVTTTESCLIDYVRIYDH